jgi:hypothetical protein
VKFAVDFSQLSCAIGLYEEIVAYVHEVITAGAVDWPLFAEELAWGQNFLADDPRGRGARAQSLEVFERISQAVDVIDAYSIEQVALEPFQDLAVGGFKDMLAPDAQADEGIHVEEAAITEFLICGAPVCKAIVLLV